MATDNTARADVTLTTTPPPLSARISPDPDTIASAPLGTPVQRSYTVQNTGPAFTGCLRGGPLGSARIDRPTLGNLQQFQRQVVVPVGTTALSARTGAAGDPAADLDLFLFNCTTGTCGQAAQGAGDSAEESVNVPTPAPDRQLLAGLRVVDGTGATVTTSRVIVQSVG